MGSRRLILVVTVLIFSHLCNAQTLLPPRTDSLRALPSLPILPQNFYTQHLGTFCRWELQLQKRSTLPVYFRLGSKEYVDRLERRRD